MLILLGSVSMWSSRVLCSTPHPGSYQRSLLNVHSLISSHSKPTIKQPAGRYASCIQSCLCAPKDLFWLACFNIPESILFLHVHTSHGLARPLYTCLRVSNFIHVESHVFSATEDFKLGLNPASCAANTRTVYWAL